MLQKTSPVVHEIHAWDFFYSYQTIENELSHVERYHVMYLRKFVSYNSRVFFELKKYLKTKHKSP
jgi:hypothetical protein